MARAMQLSFSSMPHVDMALVWLQPTLSLSAPCPQAHRILCNIHAFAPAISSPGIPISPSLGAEELILQPGGFPRYPTPSAMSTPQYTAWLYRCLGSHLTPSHALLPRVAQSVHAVRENGDHRGRFPSLTGDYSGKWPHSVWSREQGMLVWDGSCSETDRRYEKFRARYMWWCKVGGGGQGREQLES